MDERPGMGHFYMSFISKDMNELNDKVRAENAEEKATRKLMAGMERELNPTTPGALLRS